MHVVYELVMKDTKTEYFLMTSLFSFEIASSIQVRT